MPTVHPLRPLPLLRRLTAEQGDTVSVSTGSLSGGAKVPQWRKKTPRGRLSSSPAARRKFLICKAVARDGIEPPTRGFSVRCSTN